MTELSKAGPLGLSRSEYHADTRHVSHSALEVFRESIPTYHGRYVSKVIRQPEPAEHHEIGNAFHVLLLEPHRYRELVAVVPGEINRRTKEGREQYEAFRLENAGRHFITEEQHDEILYMRESVLADPSIACLLECAGEFEFGVEWPDDETGIACKCRFDRVCLPDGRRIILDLKTAADPLPGPWGRAAANYGYHRQQEFYLSGAEAFYGERPEFLFLVVGKKPPHEAILYSLDFEAAEIGRTQNRDDLSDLHDCRRFGTWQSRHAGGTNLLSLPRFALQDSRKYT